MSLGVQNYAFLYSLHEHVNMTSIFLDVDNERCVSFTHINITDKYMIGSQSFCPNNDGALNTNKLVACKKMK